MESSCKFSIYQQHCQCFSWFKWPAVTCSHYGQWCIKSLTNGPNEPNYSSMVFFLLLLFAWEIVKSALRTWTSSLLLLRPSMAGSGSRMGMKSSFCLLHTAIERLISLYFVLWKGNVFNWQREPVCILPHSCICLLFFKIQNWVMNQRIWLNNINRFDTIKRQVRPSHKAKALRNERRLYFVNDFMSRLIARAVNRVHEALCH